MAKNHGTQQHVLRVGRTSTAEAAVMLRLWFLALLCAWGDEVHSEPGQVVRTHHVRIMRRSDIQPLCSQLLESRVCM